MDNSSTKYFVASQQFKVNPLLNFHGNTEQFILLTTTYVPTTIRRKCIVLFPWQQWQHECTTMECVYII